MPNRGRTTGSGEPSSNRSVEAGTAEPELASGARPPSTVQPHGALLVFERNTLSLVQASEALARIVHQELPGSFAAPAETLLDAPLAARLHALGPEAEERRRVTLRGRQLEARLLALDHLVMVELEPASEEDNDLAGLGERLDETALQLSQATGLAELGRIACDALLKATGFANAALVRGLSPGHVQIMAEASNGMLPSLSARPTALKALTGCLPKRGLVVVNDTGAAGVRLLSVSAGYDEAGLLDRAELASPPIELLQPLAASGVVSMLILPVGEAEPPWGHLILENPFERPVGHDRRRFALTVGQLVASAIERVQRHAKMRAERLAPEVAATFLATVGDGTNPLQALLLGDRLLATAVGADGVAVLSGNDCAMVGPTPDPEALLRQLPRLLRGRTKTIATNDLEGLGGFARGELAGSTAMVAVRLAAHPFIALAAFRDERGPERDLQGGWEPPLVEAFYAIGEIFRRILLLGDAAAAAELSSQIGEFEEHAFGPGTLRSAIMASSAGGMALVSGRPPETLKITESNLMFRRLFGIEAQDHPTGTIEDLARQLHLPPGLVVDSGQRTTEIELWSSELGPRIVEVDVRSIVRTRFAGGRRDLTLIQATDVTRIRRQEVAMRMARDQALALIRTREELMANMSHELRTPLNAVIGFAEMISQETLGPIGNPRYATYGADIETAGRHLLALINDVLDLSRLSTGKQLLDEAVIDPVALLRSCVDWAKAASRRRAVSLTIDAEGAVPGLRCDERALRQVIINLISNAVKFTPDGGHVETRLRWRRRGEFTIEVIDDGIGMSASEVNRAFEPFFRGGGAYQRRIEGAGLGLAIAKGLIELHGGTLILISAEGQGTTVRIELPAWRVMQPEESGEEDAPPLQATPQA